MEIFKIAEEKREVTATILIPEIPDAQGDCIGVEEIQAACHDFMLRYNKQESSMGLMHKELTSKIQILESYCAPCDFEINKKQIAMGTWILKVKILDDDLWESVKDGSLQGFSIGGRGKRVEEN